MLRRTTIWAYGVLALSLQAQDTVTPEPQPERWNLFYQATAVGQTHGTFRSPYQGPNSLQNANERDVSLTTTLFFGLRLDRNTQIYFDPEIAGGRGFSGVTGIASFANGELPRVAAATPKPYVARAYITHDFGFGKDREDIEGQPNQLGGSRPMNRYTIIAGRFTVTDFFDGNRYSHDPRAQILNWATMYNGAWDYPADTRGYTYGWVHEFHTKHWSARYSGTGEPRTANGGRFDRRVFRDRGDTFEGEYRWGSGPHDGTVRLLGFVNHSRAGTYAEATHDAERSGGTPDITATRRAGTLKYGTGVSFDQEIIGGVGVFSRLGWNDGKTESWAFTTIDRLASGGVSVNGGRWHRKSDTAATSFTASGISGVHALYLARGGLDFLIGDGRLNYSPEYVWESYYSVNVLRGFFATLDLQRVSNPAFNQDRGPVWIPSLRLHLELGRGSGH